MPNVVREAKQEKIRALPAIRPPLHACIIIKDGKGWQDSTSRAIRGVVMCSRICEIHLCLTVVKRHSINREFSRTMICCLVTVVGARAAVIMEWCSYYNESLRDELDL